MALQEREQCEWRRPEVQRPFLPDRRRSSFRCYGRSGPMGVGLCKDSLSLGTGELQSEARPICWVSGGCRPGES